MINITDDILDDAKNSIERETSDCDSIHSKNGNFTEYYGVTRSCIEILDDLRVVYLQMYKFNKGEEDRIQLLEPKGYEAELTVYGLDDDLVYTKNDGSEVKWRESDVLSWIRSETDLTNNVMLKEFILSEYEED